MSISAIGSTTKVPVDQTSSGGVSAAVEASVSRKQNGGSAPNTITAPASTGKSSSSNSDLARLKMLANEHMTASAIAQQLGKSVSAVMQEAAAAGIKLSAGSTGNSPAASTGNPAKGNNVNTKV